MRMSGMATRRSQLVATTALLVFACESMSPAAETIGPLPAGVKPVVQTDNGSGYISQEFKKVLTENGLGHIRITPHCPEENGLVERTHRTLGEVLNEMELTDLEQARARIAQGVRWYNEG